MLDLASAQAACKSDVRPLGRRHGNGQLRALTALAAALAAAAVCTAGGLAYWTVGSVAAGSGLADIAALDTGATPSGTLAGRTAILSWAQSTVVGTALGSLPSGGYRVRRYAANDPGTPLTPGASCNGSIVGGADPLSCAGSPLPTGRWLYAVTPEYHLWTGLESAQGGAVVVAPDAPTSVALTNGAGVGNAFVNAANAPSLSFDVVLPSTSLGSDTVHLTVSDGASTVSAAAAGIGGGGTRSLTGVDVSSLADGALTITGWVTSSYGDGSASVALSGTKDTVAPSIATMVTGDAGGAAGVLDRVTVTFSETLEAYSAGAAPWALANAPSGGTLASVTAAGAVATLTITEGAGGIDTTVGAFAVALFTDATGIRDEAGNLSSFSATQPADGIAPVQTAMALQDVDGNGKVDQVSATFSETLAASTDTSPWTLVNVPSGGALAAFSTSGTVATMVLAEGAGAASTAVGAMTVALAASATGVTDPAGNQSGFAAAAPTDGARPALLTLTTRDADTDGRIDRAVAVFSETLAAYSAGTGPWTLANTPSGGALASVAVATDTATLTITEGAGAADTAVGSFTVALATSAAGIRDAAANLSTFAATRPGDGAGPVPISVTTTAAGATAGLMEAGDALAATFSEPILASSVPATATITERDPNGSTNDRLAISSMTNGELLLGANNYISANNRTASFASSTLAVSGATVTATVAGTCMGTGCASLAAGRGALVFTAATTVTDAAGNTATGSFTAATTFRAF